MIVRLLQAAKSRKLDPETRERMTQRARLMKWARRYWPELVR